MCSQGKAAAMSDADLDATVTEIQADGPSGCAGTDFVAYNATVRAIGRTDAIHTLNTWQRLLAMVS